MASWKVAESLDRLLAQLNAFAPNRSKVSDGSIGDAAHATRDSDHNPWYVLKGQPLVTARDFTHDPAGGLDCNRLATALLRARDSRLKYLIWNRRIIDSRAAFYPWQWRPYEGINPHDHHLHLSVVADPRCRDGSPWMLPGLVVANRWPTIKLGDTGTAVGVIQRFLGVQPVDEVFGPVTETAVKRYQAMRGLEPDGVVGPITWAETGL